ncbi:MAG: hypothetical protein EPO52_15255 [Herbiconiux sp.]|uniref:hypothetical protein n=1 Tax=Herbiconiux sp. TaxID=1871186 RepID=UPI0012011FF6|nr:hypothetical protein [Herbiconiux sp.]TAJ46886.1 MAG: hypothetical protein EPO52_15255 [Herbiconiux sp.]
MSETPVPPIDGESANVPIDAEVITVGADLDSDEASHEIAKAVSARHSIARRYVKWLRRRKPDASPAEIIRILERHYGSAITAAGTAITVGAIAADVGIAMIPVAGPATAGVKSVSAHTGKAAVKAAAKNVGLSAAKTGAQHVSTYLPAGDKQLQFEITAIFGLGLAEIHGMRLDQDQAQALVFGLSNERISQEQIATMAADVATISADGVVAAGTDAAAGRSDWANTLANSLPAGRAQSLVRTMQTGQLDPVRDSLSSKQQTAVDYGVAALSSGITRFVFGRDVILSSRTAFPEPPDEFPENLAIPVKAKPDDDDSEGNAAVAALQEAAKSTGSRITGTAGAVGGGVAAGAVAAGSGVATAAATVSSPFRSVDIDGDGIPDEARAVTAAKSVGGAITGAAGAVGGGIRDRFRSKKREDDDR